jgi:hypothetical protein
MLQQEIEKMLRTRQRGKVLVNVDQLKKDLRFMEYAGEETVYIVFDDGRFVKLDSLEDLSKDMKDVW